MDEACLVDVREEMKCLMDGEIDPYNVKLLAKGDKEKKIKESLHKEVLDVRCGKIKLSKGKKNSKILKIDHPTSPAAIIKLILIKLIL